jgi:parvulin-like peptidyl-prolyl isomerase
MKQKFSTLLLLTSGCLLAVSCNRSSPPVSGTALSLAPDALATIEGRTIRLKDFAAEMKHRAGGRADAFARAEEREALLRDMLDFEAVFHRAQEAGFAQKPEIARQIKTFIVQRFIQEQLTGEPELPPISDGEIQEYYNDHASRFAIPEKVRFAVIQFGFSPKATEEKRTEVFRRAETVLAEARVLDAAEHGFGALAQRYSEDQATRYSGGDAGWLARGEESRWPAAVSDAAFALANPGDVSPVIKTSNGCYLVRLIEKKVAGHRPLEEVAEAIRYQLAVEKRHQRQQAFYDSLKSGLKIEINHALLESVSAPTVAPQRQPPALPES